MFSRWNHDLKKSLLQAIIYYRLEELELNPFDRLNLARLDFVFPAGEVVSGWQTLKVLLSEFFVARDADLNRPYDTTSTLRYDAAILMSRLEQPNQVFDGAARHTALQVTERLLCAHGLRTRMEEKRVWESNVAKIFVATPMADRANRYSRLLLDHWAGDKLMPPQELWPHEFFSTTSHWAREIAFEFE